MIEGLMLRIRGRVARARQLLAGLPGGVAVMGLLLVAGGLWLRAHHSRLRQASELLQRKQEAEGEVAKLEARAQAAAREAHERRARAMRELARREQQAAQRSAQLREQAAWLQKKEHAKHERVADLPASELGKRVATQLGLSLQAFTPRAEPGGRPGSGASHAPFALDEPGLRKVGSALVELDACRERTQLLDQQVASLDLRLAAQAALASEQGVAMEKLDDALRAKDEILARRDAAHRAELKAVRGNFFTRAARVLQHVAIGVVLR